MHAKKIAEIDISEILRLYDSLPEGAFRSVTSENEDKRYYKLDDKSVIENFLDKIYAVIYEHHKYKGISQANLIRVHADYIIDDHQDQDQYNPAGASIEFPERFTKEYDRLEERYGIQRFHLPLIVDLDNVFFLIEGEEVRMKPGELWWIDHYRPHAVINNGTIDRVHFIVDTYTTEIDRSTDWS